MLANRSGICIANSETGHNQLRALVADQHLCKRTFRYGGAAERVLT
jgi:hypothetical protein